jgi:Lrp/AsnC family transcriptional regulator for asnA, asnC and gidA
LKFKTKNLTELTFINSPTSFLFTLQKFDELDMKLLFELTKDGAISVPELSKKLGLNASVL